MEPPITVDRGRVLDKQQTAGVHLWRPTEKVIVKTHANIPRAGHFASEQKMVAVGMASFSGNRGTMLYEPQKVTAVTNKGISVIELGDAEQTGLFQSALRINHLIPGREFTVTMATPFGSFAADVTKDEIFENKNDFNPKVKEEISHAVNIDEWTQITDQEGNPLPVEQQIKKPIYVDEEVPPTFGFSFTLKNPATQT